MPSFSPEGTTGEGVTLLPFHSNLFQAAVAAQAHVQPVTILYMDDQGRQSLAPAYVGDMTLIDTLDAMLDAEPLQVHLYVGPGIEPGNETAACSLAKRNKPSLQALQRCSVAKILPLFLSSPTTIMQGRRDDTRGEFRLS